MSEQRLLFVTNGHGEAAIAARLAAEVRHLAPVATDHFALVGEGFGAADFPDVGPQRRMPSGGLVAMGNVGAFSQDVRAGWFRLFAAQWRFLRERRAHYDTVVAVGDTYACAMARRLRRPLVFVGTAKSVYVARYGPLEARIISGARRIFVRDAATAADLVARGVRAEAPGNVIVDLLATAERFAWPAASTVRLALLPGSRERAYGDAIALAAIVRHVAAVRPTAAALSIAPGLDAVRFAAALAGANIAAWGGPIGALFPAATLVIGQAGTANEAAAAAGVPVVACELSGARRDAWYRKRQRGLLGEAMTVVPGDPVRAAAAVIALIDDPARRDRMAATGRERMGSAGGAAAIAHAILEVLAEPSAA